jgi:membrane protein DedA with SNARE-associated domain
MSTLFIIFVIWSIIGAILWQIIILLPMAKNKPNGPLTKLDYIKIIPFGSVIWLTYLLTIREKKKNEKKI